MIDITEVRTKKILNPTSIDLGEYVINPFMGCGFSCLFCYVRSNRVVSRKGKPWGSYIDVRVNAPELLEKELANEKPKTVLLGSTTECFQPIEKKYGLMRQILETLHRHGVSYYILSRSPHIVEYIPLLRQGFCRNIYFSVNRYGDEFKGRLEPQSPSFESRDGAVNRMLDDGVPVVPYFSPVLPWISDIRDVFGRYPKAREIGFECLNCTLGNFDRIVEAVAAVKPSLKAKYRRMLRDKEYYVSVWETLEQKVKHQAEAAHKEYEIYVHSWGGYFQNRYAAI